MALIDTLEVIADSEITTNFTVAIIVFDWLIFNIIFWLQNSPSGRKLYEEL